MPHETLRTRIHTRCAAAAAALALAIVTGAALRGDAAPSAGTRPVDYVLSFDRAAQHVVSVEVWFRELGEGPLEARMARSSPGRYALHDFAKNVYDVQAFDANGRTLRVERPNPHQWNVADHGGTVRVTYEVYGDQVDGTYLAVDATHAHMNIPATLMYAEGLDERPATVTLRRPLGSRWQVATQLFPTADPLVFTAPNRQYLMDSPIEFGNIALRSFTVPPLSGGHPATVRVAMHHRGSDAELDAYVRDVERIVREEQAIFGELPAFEPGHFTFIVDYLPWANGDGMEHRNSTVISSSASLASGRRGLLGTVAHEFFHVWNVERIRPRSLEPFDFDEANPSPDLWFAEGFTSYHGTLTLVRAGLTSFDELVDALRSTVDTIVNGAGRRFRSAEEMSLMAQFVDGARAADRTNLDATHISYYTFGMALGLALDLSLRERSDGRATLDDVFRGLWQTHGTSAGVRPGYVARPYTLADIRQAVAAAAADERFADRFVNAYITGHDAPDYQSLLARAGLVLRRRSPGRSWIGPLSLDFGRDGARVVSPTTVGTPAWHAGIGQDDVVVSIDGRRLTSVDVLSAVLAEKPPGQSIDVSLVRRDDTPVHTAIVLAEDPALELVPVERTGAALTPAQRAFRESWVGRRAAR